MIADSLQESFGNVPQALSERQLRTLQISPETYQNILDADYADRFELQTALFKVMPAEIRGMLLTELNNGSEGIKRLGNALMERMRLQKTPIKFGSAKLGEALTEMDLTPEMSGSVNRNLLNEFNANSPRANAEERQRSKSRPARIRVRQRSNLGESPMSEQGAPVSSISSSFNPTSIISSSGSLQNRVKLINPRLADLLDLHQDRELVAVQPNRFVADEKYNSQTVKPRVGPNGIYNNAIESMFQSMVPKNNPRLYDSYQTQRDNPGSAAWNMIPGAVFDTENDTWVGEGRGKPYRPPTAAQIEKQTLIGKEYVTVENALQYISPLIAFSNAKLKDLGFGGIGPVSQNGAPLFMGRWYDSQTNRIKSFLKPRYAYNPTNFQSVLAKQVFNSINKWNAFARAEQSVLTTLKKYKEGKWPSKQNGLVRAANPARFHRKIMKNMSNQIAKNRSKLFTELANPEKQALIDSIKSWNWENFVTTVQKVANLALRRTVYTVNNLQEDINIGQTVKMLEYYKNFEVNVALQLGKKKALLQLRAPESLGSLNASVNVAGNTFPDALAPYSDREPVVKQDLALWNDKLLGEEDYTEDVEVF